MESWTYWRHRSCCCWLWKPLLPSLHDGTGYPMLQWNIAERTPSLWTPLATDRRCETTRSVLTAHVQGTRYQVSGRSPLSKTYVWADWHNRPDQLDGTPSHEQPDDWFLFLQGWLGRNQHKQNHVPAEHLQQPTNQVTPTSNLAMRLVEMSASSEHERKSPRCNWSKRWQPITGQADDLRSVKVGVCGKC